MSRPARITSTQKKLLHTLAGAMGWDDDLYRAALREATGGKESCLALTEAQAKSVIGAWTDKAVALGVWRPRKTRRRSKTRYAELDGRAGMATGPQCRMIEAMWADVSRADNDESRTKALRAMLRRLVGVDDLRFLRRHHVEKLVKAFEAMKSPTQQQKEERG